LSHPIFILSHVLGAIMELLSALVGAVSALAGVGIGYWLQIRARRKERILDSAFRALALARQYQWDLSAYGMAYVNLGEFPKPLPEEDAEAAKQFALEHGLKRFADAENRLLETEKGLRLVGVDLALFTDLHRQPGDTVSFFDIIVDEICGQMPLDMVSESASSEEVNDLVFRYGAILAAFEQQAVEFLRKHVDPKIRIPESVSPLGRPKQVRPEESESPASDASANAGLSQTQKNSA
jgi:hypothetical protein